MARKRSRAELFRRWLFLAAGLLIMALGVACSIQADLGTSPVSSLPYVLSRITPLSVGTTTILVNSGLVLLQILILRRRYDPLQLLQLPVAVAFGYLTDLALWAVDFLQPAAYWQQWLLCLAGILLVGVGVSFEVTAGVATMAGEGVVLAICQVALGAVRRHEGGRRRGPCGEPPASSPCCSWARWPGCGRAPWPRPCWWARWPGG